MKKTQSDYGCLFEPVVAHCLLYKTPPLEMPTTIQKSMTVCKDPPPNAGPPPPPTQTSLVKYLLSI